MAPLRPENWVTALIFFFFSFPTPEKSGHKPLRQTQSPPLSTTPTSTSRSRNLLSLLTSFPAAPAPNQRILNSDARIIWILWLPCLHPTCAESPALSRAVPSEEKAAISSALLGTFLGFLSLLRAESSLSDTKWIYLLISVAILFFFFFYHASLEYKSKEFGSGKKHPEQALTR